MSATPDKAIELTVLNSMVSSDFESALDGHVALGLRLLDLKDAIFGKAIADLSEDDARRAASAIQRRGLQVHCLSTTLLHHDIEKGESAFRADLAKLSNVLRCARALRPRVIRVLSAATARRQEVANAAHYLHQAHDWVYNVYREAVDRIAGAGHIAMIENEAGASIFSHPDEILLFFEHLGRTSARLIWDAVNLWQAGTAPSLEVYHRLRPIIGAVHVKGGQADPGNGSLQWAAALEDSTWPVLPIVRAVVGDGACAVICLNPPHGAHRPGYCYDALPARDLAFVQSAIAEMAP